MGRLRMGELTSPAIARHADNEDAIGLVSAGALEQHGPHLPLSTDTVIAVHLADELASRLPVPAIVAPTIPFGVSEHHLGFPGTVHVPEAAFAECVHAIVRGLLDAGLRRIALFSSHGGNFLPLGRVAAAYEGDPRASVIAYDDLPRYASVMTRAAAEQGLDVPACDIHAGGLETSQMLHLFGPDRIAMDPPPEGYVDAEPGWLDQLFTGGMKSLSATGILGRPAGARSDVGQAVCSALVEELAAWIARSFSLDLEPAVGRPALAVS
jgi:creatinine amidohydrolase